MCQRYLTTRSHHLVVANLGGLPGQYTGQTDTFVELKTSLAIRGQRDEANFERYDYASHFIFILTHADGSWKETTEILFPVFSPWCSGKFFNTFILMPLTFHCSVGRKLWSDFGHLLE